MKKASRSPKPPKTTYSIQAVRLHVEEGKAPRANARREPDAIVGGFLSLEEAMLAARGIAHTLVWGNEMIIVRSHAALGALVIADVIMVREEAGALFGSRLVPSCTTWHSGGEAELAARIFTTTFKHFIHGKSNS